MISNRNILFYYAFTIKIFLYICKIWFECDIHFEGDLKQIEIDSILIHKESATSDENNHSVKKLTNQSANQQINHQSSINVVDLINWLFDH